MNDRAEIERLLDDLIRTRAKLAAAREELAQANECDRSYMAWDPASETYCSAADVMKELIQLREMYVHTASQAAKLRAELATARAAQPGTVTLPEGLDGLQRDIRFAISDPVSVVGRQEDETVPAWSARAVMHVVAAAGLLRPVLAEADVDPNPEWLADGDLFGTDAEGGAS